MLSTACDVGKMIGGTDRVWCFPFNFPGLMISRGDFFSCVQQSLVSQDYQTKRLLPANLSHHSLHSGLLDQDNRVNIIVLQHSTIGLQSFGMSCFEELKRICSLFTHWMHPLNSFTHPHHFLCISHCISYLITERWGEQGDLGRGDLGPLGFP